MKSESFVSVVLVGNVHLAGSESVLRGIQLELDAHYSDYEIVLINQGLATTFTRQDERVLHLVPSLRFIQLAAKVHMDVAWAAALENAIGDFVVMFDPESDPVSVISETVAMCRAGVDVVVGVASQPRTLAYWLGRSMSDWILRLAAYSLPRDATSLRCLSRRAVNSVTWTGCVQNQIMMRIQKTGYSLSPFQYALNSPFRSGTPRSFIMGLRSLLHLLVFNSSKPLRWMSTLGLLGSAMAFLFAVFSLLIHLFKGKVVEGWTTTIFFMSGMFMIQFVILVFFGEYLGRLLDERGERSKYSIVFEKTSTVMVNQDRINVLNDALAIEENLVQTGRKR